MFNTLSNQYHCAVRSKKIITFLSIISFRGYTNNLLEQKWQFTWYYTIFYCKLQYSVVVKLILLWNLIDKKNPFLRPLGKEFTLFNFVIFLLESVSSSNISYLKWWCKKFGKLKIFCLKLYLDSSIFISKLTSATKVLQTLLF